MGAVSVIYLVMPSYDHPLLPDSYYHVFNRAVGNEKMFFEDENYRFFLKRFCDYILPVADIYTYALIPNHFHFFLRIKRLELIVKRYEQLKRKPPDQYSTELITEFIMNQFSNWCNSYTKSFNKVYKRKGKLFIDNLHRNPVITESYFSRIVYYIHNNPVKHGIASRIGEWPFTSYNTILSDANTWLKKDELINWFGGIKPFVEFHQRLNP